MAELQKREKVLMSLAGGAAVVFALNQFVCTRSESPEPVSEKFSVQSEIDKPVLSNTKIVKPPRSRSKEPRIKFASWGRDPFALAYRLSESEMTGEDSTNFVLRGVIWKGNEAHVLIGDAILKTGDRQGDLKVLEIKKDRVICRKGRRIVTLVLRDEKS